jgi:hypothetical protein
MCAANVEAFTSWSTTLTSNQPTSTDTADIVSDLTKIQAEVRKYTATKGADIASATTTDLAGATGNYVHITGTTTITGLGTVSAGVRFLLVFDGALTFTHNATSLILPTEANITTAAGDRCEVVSLGSGNFRCLWYQRASGLPLDAELAAIAGLTSAADVVPRFTGSGTAEVYPLTSGEYTPTVQGTPTNATVGSVEVASYLQVGKTVHVSGAFTFSSGASQMAIITFNPPVAGTISNAQGVTSDSVNARVGAVLHSGGNLEFYMPSSSVSSRVCRYTATYTLA